MQRLVIFESLAISKIISLSLLTIFPKNIAEELIKIKKTGTSQLLKSIIQHLVVFILDLKNFLSFQKKHEYDLKNNLYFEWI